mmetsp:Transcript_28682/g.80841  ORF Transcript_28682/g.80841 Transcript_28682/m.80841 type:complete len:215 (-) Transcript_28682:19-663(-)
MVHRYDIVDADTFTIIFQNGAKWISITNTPIVYSHEWAQLLEYQLAGMASQNLDAIVLGKFNIYPEAKNTGFERTMNEQIALIRNTQFDVNIDFQNIPPPNLTSVAAVYDKIPIISVSMFALQDEYRAQSVRQEMRTLNRDNLVFVNGRKYMNALGECGSDDKLVVGTCHEPGDVVPNSNRNPADMHRCTGPNGGHPDLIGWDIVETLQEVLLQ